MVRYCSVPGCKGYATDKGRSFHRYPQNPTVRRQWIDALKVRPVQSPHSSVCSKHFKPEDFRRPPLVFPSMTWRTRRTLKPFAVPSENLPRHGWNLRPKKKKTVKPRKPTSGRPSKPQLRLKLSRRSQADIRTRTKTQASQFVWLRTKGTQTEETYLAGETSQEQQFRKTDNYVVAGSCLLKLFQKCTTCLALCDREVVLRGSKLVRISATCRKGHVSSWANSRSDFVVA